MPHESLPSAPLDESKIDALGHVITVGNALEGHKDFNDKIEVLRAATEGDRAQVYQMWTIDKFASHPTIVDALETFGLGGDAEKKEEWTQLLEHIGGVTAIALHIERLLEKHGAPAIKESDIEIVTLIHDIEKRKEREAAKTLAKLRELPDDAGLENDFNNEVLKTKAADAYFSERGISKRVLAAAHNTRDDTYFSDYDDYTDSEDVEIAKRNRHALAEQSGLPIGEIDAMTPAERRKASLRAKRRLTVLLRLPDAATKQFVYQGVSDDAIRAMAAHYRKTKADRQSQAFFSEDGDWVNYYAEARRYLIDQVPEANQAAFEAELNALTHERIFNETVLPEVLGASTMERARELHERGEPNVYDTLRYPEVRMERVSSWTEAKSPNPEKNEDVSFFSDNALILADGATDKSGVEYPSGKSGGRELAEIATRVAADSEKNGYELAEEITTAVRKFYETANPDALEDPSKRAASTLVVARVTGDNLVITQIGDTNVRVTLKDGSTQVFTNDKVVDTENSERRSAHIKTELQRYVDEHGSEPNTDERATIVASGRGVIQNRLNTQYQLQNNAGDSTYGYGTIDGTEIPRYFTDGTPTEFVKEYVFKTDDITSVELVSDGFYGEFPDDKDKRAYQDLYTRIHSEDPDKYVQYLSTKPKDDATVLIAQLA